MLKTREDAYRHLSNAEDNVRIVALELISYALGLQAGGRLFAFVWRRWHMMTLRSMSVWLRILRLIGRCYADTDDVRIGKLLAQLVHDASMPLSCRRSAYRECCSFYQWKPD